MSAFMCDARHLSALAQYAVSRNIYRPVNPNREISAEEQCVRVLYTANAKSLHARYGDPDDMYGPCEFVDGLSREILRVDPVAIIKSAKCYEYQACESKEWEDSEAHDLIRAIINDALYRLPGYETAPWGAPL